MAKVVEEYIVKALERGHSKKDIEAALSQKGWQAREVALDVRSATERWEKEKNEPLIAPDPLRSAVEIDIRRLTASQVLLYLGGLIIILAGVLFISINWAVWSPLGRTLAIFLPMSVVFGVGAYLWRNTRSQRQALVFIITSAFLFPLFLVVLFNQFNFFPQFQDFLLVLSALTFSAYILVSMIYVYPIWSLMITVSGFFAIFSVMQKLEIARILGDDMPVWIFLLISFVVSYIGYIYETSHEQERARYIYAPALAVSIVTSIILIETGALFKVFGTRAGGFIDFQNQAGASAVIFGFVYVLIGYFLKELSELRKLTELVLTKNAYNLFGVIAVLGGLLMLSAGAKKPVLELLLLGSSLGFVFSSIKMRSQEFLYMGSLFLVISIFDIGGEYFQNQVGWPITLFIAGLLSMGVGLGMERLRKLYFK